MSPGIRDEKGVMVELAPWADVQCKDVILCDGAQ